MKILITLFIFTLSTAFAGTCSTTTRTNYSSGQTLTSSALNADFNQLVTKVNALDGGCVTDGTLEAGALNSTDFAAVTNGIKEGCPVSYSDANTVSVGKCILSVNGTFVKTTVATTATWGCSGCSAEANSTQYYIYAKTGSTGTTLSLLISTSAPNADGYDGSGNKVIGRFYNDSSGNISRYSINSYSDHAFTPTDGILSVDGLSASARSFMISWGDTETSACTNLTACAYINQTGASASNVNKSGTGTYLVTLASPWTKIQCTGDVIGSVPVQFKPVSSLTSATTVTFTALKVSDGTPNDAYGTAHCEGY